MNNGFGTSPLELMACEAMLQGLAYCDEFAYNASFTTGTTTALAANGTTDVQIFINGDSDFIAEEYNLTAWSVAGTQIASPDITILIIRSGSGRQVMDQAMTVRNLCGNYGITSANNPGRKPFASLYQSQQSVTIRLADRSGTNWNLVQFSMNGFKVFYQTNSKGETGTRTGIFHAL
jgi:hypothetical protein